MNDEITEMKRQSLEQRQAKRDSENASVLESLGLEAAEEPALEVSDSYEDVTLKSKPKPCPTCYGKGTVKGVCLTRECETCYGTGYSLTDPIALIKWQKLCMQWAKAKIREQEKQLHLATTTEEERLEESVKRSYSGAKYNKHD